MRITETLAGEACGNGVTCDRVLATNGDDVVVQGRYLSAAEAAGLGLDVAPHEGLLLIKRGLLDDLRAS